MILPHSKTQMNIKSTSKYPPKSPNHTEMERLLWKRAYTIPLKVLTFHIQCMCHFELCCSYKEYKHWHGLHHQKFVSGSCYITIVMWHGLCSFISGNWLRMKTCGGLASLWQGEYRTTGCTWKFLLTSDTYWSLPSGLLCQSKPGGHVWSQWPGKHTPSSRRTK